MSVVKSNYFKLTFYHAKAGYYPKAKPTFVHHALLSPR